MTFSYSGSATTFVVPTRIAKITITTVGATGGAGVGAGGKGASIRGDFSLCISGCSLTQGATLSVLVGGGGDNNSGGGGGGSFVWGGTGFPAAATNLLVAAGGGGGGGGFTGALCVGLDATVPSAGTPPTSSAGTSNHDNTASGGAGSLGGGGGAGFGFNGGGGGGVTGSGLSGGNGLDHTGGGGGQAINAGGAEGSNLVGGNGGFGGGSGRGAGGGGGYSGGGGGDGGDGSCGLGLGSGGGGGFYNGGTSQNNQASANASGNGSVMISWTLPAVTVALTSPNGGTPNGSNGWFTSSPVGASVTATDAVTITAVNCTDNGNPLTIGSLTTLPAASASGTLSISGDGTHSILCTATDANGNSGATPASTNTAMVKIDTTAPTVNTDTALDSCSTPGSNGWCVGTQTAGFNASDATSGVASPCTAAGGASCTFTQQSTTNGAAVTIASGSVSDVAGNTNLGINSAAYKIDSVAPTVITDTALDSCATPGSNGWCRGTQTAGFQASDATSGVASPCTAAGGSSCTFTQQMTTNGTAVTIASGAVSDVAGNSAASINAAPFKIDSVAPTAPVLNFPSVSGGSVVTNAPVPGTVSTTDAGSGVASLTCTDNTKALTIGALTTLPAASANGTLSISGPGAHSVSCTAVDVAGNTSVAGTASFQIFQPEVFISQPAPLGTPSVTPTPIPSPAPGSTKSPTPTATATAIPGCGTVTYAAGYNLAGGPTGTVLAGAAGSLFTFQASDVAYETLPVTAGLTAPEGYWAFFFTPTTVTLPCVSRQTLTVTLPAGHFIMAGNPGDTAATLSGADVVDTFNPATNSYTVTTGTATLASGQGAWVFSRGGGTLTIANQ